MKAPLDTAAAQSVTVQTPPDIFARLENHKIDYWQIKRIVQLETPNIPLIFARSFKGHTIEQVIKLAWKWQALLKEDFILTIEKEVKAKAERFVLQTELFAWQVLLQVNSRIGPWQLGIRPLPTSRDESGQPVFINPSQEIVAIHGKTKKTRTALIPGGAPFDFAAKAEAWRQAFHTLGLWDQMWRGDPSNQLMSGRAAQGWPFFTRLIIPRLYEFMIPHYESRGHHWARHSGGSRRLAEIPKALLVDMLEILRMEHPYAFDSTTLPQLKADIRRHLARKGKKHPKKLSRPKTAKRLT